MLNILKLNCLQVAALTILGIEAAGTDCPAGIRFLNFHSIRNG